MRNPGDPGIRILPGTAWETDVPQSGTEDPVARRILLHEEVHRMKRNIRNLSKTLSMLMLAGCMLIFTACGSGSAGKEPSASDTGSDAEAEYTLMLSYANESYIESGDEALDKLIRNIPVTVDLAEDAEDELVAETIVNQLKAGSGTASRGGENFVTDAFALNYVLSSDGYCILDFRADGLEDLNETAEQFAVYQIVDSVLNTLDDIDGVTFTLDSEQVDSIKGGNMDWKMTYTRDDVEEFMQVEIREADLNEAKTETQEAIQEQGEEKNADKESEKKETKKTDKQETKAENTKKSTEDTSKKDADPSDTANDSSNDNGSSGNGSDGNGSDGNGSSDSNKTDSNSGGQSSGSGSETGNGSSHDNGGTATDNSGSGNGSGSNGSSGSSDGGSSDSGSGSQSSGTSTDSGSSGATQADSGSSSSSGTQDGVVNDD